MVVEGAAAVYWNRKYYIQFLDECLKAHNDNILQENLFIVLSSMEMISLCRVFAIVYFSISLPLRWLAGNSHLLSKFDWSIRSMGKAIDLLEDAMLTIEADSSKFLEDDFMMNIFKPISSTMKDFSDHLQFVFEQKVTPTISKNEFNLVDYNNSKVLQFDKLQAELFWSEKKENRETANLVSMMVVQVTQCFLNELRNPKKLHQPTQMVMKGYSVGIR